MLINIFLTFLTGINNLFVFANLKIKSQNKILELQKVSENKDHKFNDHNIVEKLIELENQFI